MLKNKSKVLVAILVILLMISTFSFATNTPTDTAVNPISTAPGDNAKIGEENAPDTTTQPQDNVDIHEGDLYIFDNNIVMDQLIDGNVYIFGSNVEITGKINGNLFVCANKLTFQKGSYVVQAVYACANEIQFSGNAGDLYAMANKMNMSYDGFVIRDLKAFAATFTLNGGIGRDANISAKNFTFVTEEGKAGIVYGNLTYHSESQLDIPSSYVQGSISYSKYTDLNQTTIQNTIYQYVMSFFRVLLFALVLYLLLLLLTPKFIGTCSSFVSTKAVPAIGIGILLFLIIPIASILLMIIPVTTTIGASLLGIYSILLALCSAIVTIVIATKIKEKFNFTKIYQTLLVIAATALVLWALQLIPYLGAIITFLVIFSGFGIIFMSLFMKNFGKNKEKKEKKEKAKKPEKKVEDK